jgi:hypothetical protein
MSRPLRLSIQILGAACLSALFVLSSCTDEASQASRTDTAPADSARFVDRTASHLPTDALQGLSMDAHPADLDGDGDLDLVIAHEFRPNILLENRGDGTFRDASDQIPSHDRDSEDVGIADFDGDGDPDVLVVTEDDTTNEYYVNRGDGTFEDAGGRWPVAGTSNAIAVADVTGDDAPDVVVGNNGQNRLLVNDGRGGFTDETDERLPAHDDVTQDVEFGDADGDGDLDLLVGNEDANRLLLNDGTGVFADAPSAALPIPDAPEETREADFGDVDGDGDLDIHFANVRLFVEGADRQNRLLLNDGAGTFTDVTADRLPTDSLSALDGDLIDLDGDGDLDILTSNVSIEGRSIAPAPFEVFVNDGSGRFTRDDGRVLPSGTTGRGFDSEAFDADGDGRLDLYLCSREGVDRLLLRRD